MRPIINLGDVAKDTITGFAGVVIAKTEWLNGCVRLTLQSKEMKDGKPIDSQTFDIEQLEFVKAKARVASNTGGDRPNVAQRQNISR